ncbi:MAG: hypothetical protein ACRESP_08665, partial [Pseudomonas sp.]
TILLANALLSGDFGRDGSSEGLAIVETATGDAVSGARVALANAYVAGRGVARDPARGIRILESGAANGEVEAGLLLASYHLEGRAGLPRSVTAASTVLAQIEPNLKPEVLQREQVLLEVSRLVSTGRFDTILSTFDGLPPDEKTTVLRRVYGVSPNAYVYLIQVGLAARDAFDGAANGKLNSQTISAINAFCAVQGIADVCRFGPLSPMARTAVARALY